MGGITVSVSAYIIIFRHWNEHKCIHYIEYTIKIHLRCVKTVSILLDLNPIKIYNITNLWVEVSLYVVLDVSACKKAGLHDNRTPDKNRMSKLYFAE